MRLYISFFRSTQTFSLIITWYPHLCLKMTAITANSYRYYLQHSSQPNAANFRVAIFPTNVTTRSDICQEAYAAGGAEFAVLLRRGFESSSKIVCPAALHGQFEYNYTSATGVVSCQTASHHMDVCRDKTKLTFPDPCKQSIIYAVGEVYCVDSVSVGSDTFVQLYNPQPTVDGSTTYRMSCMVISSDSRTASVVYKNCTTNMSPTTGARRHDGVTIGALIAFFPYVFCRDDTSYKCQPGQYGPKCEDTCGNCVDGTATCSVTDGTCWTKCAPGYDYAADRTCKTHCLPGHYGTNCTEICGHCIGGITTCQVTDGTCPVGCASGYDYAADRTCNTDCHPGKYGPSCSDVCGHCINGTSTCFVNNGTCPSGCVPGYNPADSLCKTVCLAGTYGPGCSKRCGHCSVGPGLCSKTDGICLSGDCSMGFTGPTCHTAVNILQEPGSLFNTSQSSQFFNRDSSLAIDGLKGLDPKTCNCCSQTKNAEVSWWQVDLGVIVPIDEIIVYGQADAVYEQLSGFSVYLSITESFPDLPFVTEPSSYVNVSYRIDVDGTYARYVRIQRIGVLIICEVEIFVTGRTCPPNTYGLNCIQCGHCKTAFSCDEITGRCPNGCEDGYSDDKCIKARDDEDSFSTKYVAGAAVGGAVGGAMVMFLIGGCILVFRRKNKLRLRLPCRTSEDYESPKPSANTEDQNAYDTLDLSAISDQRDSENNPEMPRYQNITM